MTSIHDIREFEFPSGFKSYKPKKKWRVLHDCPTLHVEVQKKKWVYVWDWFIAFIVALGIFMLGLLWYISGIEVASAHWDDTEICQNLDEYSNGSDYREYCVKEIL